MFFFQGKSRIGQLNATEFALCLFMASLIAVSITNTVYVKAAVVYLFIVYLLLKGLHGMKAIVVDSNKKKHAYTKNETANRELPLIVDGSIQHDNLSELKQTELWLRQQLKKFGYKDIRKIAYCSLKGKHSFFVDLF